MSAEQLPPPCAPLVGAVPSTGSCFEQGGALLARQWFPVARTDQVAAKPRPLSLLGVRLTIYRMPDGVRIARDKCPHRGLQLSTGRVEGDELVCAYHGLRFGSDGHCREAPEKLALKALDGLKVTLFSAVERHGFVWTCLEPQGEPGIPDIRLKTEPAEAGKADLVFQISPEDWMDSIELKFSNSEITIEDSQHKSLRNLALSEYQRLFEEMAIGTTARAILPSRI